MTKPANQHTGTGTGINQTGTGLRTSVALKPTLAMGAVGAIVGGTAAAARNISRVHNNEITRNEAVTDSIKEAGTTGVATATASAVVRSIGLTGTLSLVGLVALTIGAKYAADKVVSCASASCSKSIEAAPCATDTATAKESSKKKSADAKK